MPESLIVPTPVEGIWIVPGHRDVMRANELPRDQWGERINALGELLAGPAEDFGAVLIDCAPTLHLSSYAALSAADGLVVPMQPEDYGAQGIRAIHGAFAAVREFVNPRLALLGYLLTMVQKVGVHRAYEESLRTLYGLEVFTAVMPSAAVFKEAVSARLPVSHYKPRSAAARAAADVAAELMTRAALAVELPEGQGAAR